jgi:hypothetical protein
VKLPNSEQAVVDIAKIREYALNPEHLQGKHKARVFAAALGFTVKDAETLRNLILTVARTQDAVPTDEDEYGQRFIIDFEVKRDDKQAIVRSAGIVRKDENFPRLTLCAFVRWL